MIAGIIAMMISARHDSNADRGAWLHGDVL
jgi:hypothetical protein